jgi:hypothetical protein
MDCALIRDVSRQRQVGQTNQRGLPINNGVFQDARATRTSEMLSPSPEVIAMRPLARFFVPVMSLSVSSVIRFPAVDLVAPAALIAEPEPSPPDKSGYHLFHPTPRALMREMSTDRPDQTESAYTVDAGHFQLEMDFANFTYDHHSAGGVRTETWNVAPVNLKVGLLNRVDLQVILDNYVNTRTKDSASGTTERASGFGDITTRLKINLWGNDGGKTAFSLMPFVKLPLSESNLRNGDTEGGIILPFAADLPRGWGMGAMTELDFVSDGTGDYETEWVNSITFSHDLTERIGGYVEFFSVTGTAAGFQWQGQVDFGLTYAATENVRFDLGCNFGVTKSAPDYNPFIGLSVRF